MQAVVHLHGITNEPGHPQELVALLLAAAVLLSSRGKPGPLPVSSLALLCAALALIKINAGGFLGLALLLTVRAHASDRFARGGWTVIAGGLIAVLPFILMRHHLSASWCRHYAMVVAVAIALTFVVASHCAGKVDVGPSVYGRMAGWFSGTWAAILGLLLLTGTSLTGCLEGLLLTPLKMPGVALQPLLLPSAVGWSAGLSAGAAAVLLWMPARPWARWLTAALKGLYGLAGGFLLVDAPLAQLGFLLPWAWLILLPPDRQSWSKLDLSFGRVFLCLSAAWQALQAYPIAGTQAAVGTLLLVVIYAICLRDAWIALVATAPLQQWQRSLSPTTAPLLRGLVGAGLLYLFAMVWCPPHLWRRTYANLTPLALPGAQAIRMEAEGAQLYQRLTEYLRTESDTFVTYPGVNSLYFWTGRRPPTQLNSTGWGQLTPAQQAHILHALTQARRPLLVVHEYVTQGWQDPKRPATPIDTLIAFVNHRCEEVTRIGPYIFYRPHPGRTRPEP
jgi:hypothetical protein